MIFLTIATFSISFLNLNSKSFREIRQEFTKFGEVVRQTTGGGSNTDELLTISYNEKGAAVRALQSHFTNKDYPYLDIAKGKFVLRLVPSSVMLNSVLQAPLYFWSTPPTVLTVKTTRLPSWLQCEPELSTLTTTICCRSLWPAVTTSARLCPTTPSAEPPPRPAVTWSTSS